MIPTILSLIVAMPPRPHTVLEMAGQKLILTHGQAIEQIPTLKPPRPGHRSK